MTEIYEKKKMQKGKDLVNIMMPLIILMMIFQLLILQ